MSAHPVNTTSQLTELRKLMRSQNLDVYVVPTDDAHASEYVAPCDFRRAFICGFTGSAGTALIKEHEALLFTDGRYFLQAGQQLDNNWTLMKRGEKDVPTWQEYLEQLPENTRIGVDGTTISISDANTIKSKATLINTPSNLVDEVWGNKRPARPTNLIILHDIKYSGKKAQDKIAELRKELVNQKVGAFVVSSLDDIAWLFNLRGSDIDFNPVFFSFALVTSSTCTLYAQSASLSESITSYLQTLNVEIKPYNEIYEALQQAKTDQKVLLSEQASWALAHALCENHKVGDSPVAIAKSIKNEVEIEGFRQCHIRDGAALVAYFAWLEETLLKGEKIDEAQAADVLEEYRSKLDMFKGLSFTTISSTGPNGAVIHYSPQHDDCAVIDPKQMYLCDSGGQYSDGTTDVTRTLHFGTPSDEEKDAFTRVLQGHIALDRAVFPNGTTGYQLDTLARAELWKHGLDYKHGTGHGVGSYLNVHEGPQSISMRITSNKFPLKAGNTVSNEPGYYKDGHWGIRIENVVVVQEAALANNYGGKGYLRMENVTMAPIQTKLIVKEMLTKTEVDWVNAYHAEVFEKVSPHLQKDQRALAWLKEACTAI